MVFRTHVSTHPSWSSGRFLGCAFGLPSRKRRWLCLRFGVGGKTGPLCACKSALHGISVYQVWSPELNLRSPCSKAYYTFKTMATTAFLRFLSWGALSKVFAWPKCSPAQCLFLCFWHISTLNSKPRTLSPQPTTESSTWTPRRCWSCHIFGLHPVCSSCVGPGIEDVGPIWRRTLSPTPETRNPKP